ncbi:MAG TPA: chromate transporter [Candidatus Ozemobacteraceae bacterium]|nr:chromate transporter [Candidatus Ozemobacteraceae bacterium]
MITTLAKLALSFALIGLGAYGGGMVTIPLIQHELVDGRHWLTFAEMARLVAIAQMTPGPIAINAATYVGFGIAGVIGSVVATASVVLPSLTILAWLAPVIDRVREEERTRAIQWGIQLGVVSLILFATWSYGRSVITDGRSLAAAVGSFALLVGLEGKLHPMAVVLAMGLTWLALF